MKKINILDDENAIVDLLGNFLEDDYDVTKLNTVAECLHEINNNKPDLLIADIFLFGESSFDILKYIKEQNIQIPCILITAKPIGPIRDEAIELGAVTILEKPFKIKMLKEMVKEILESE
jgi:DNA-binding NtrC family response regulator